MIIIIIIIIIFSPYLFNLVPSAVMALSQSKSQVGIKLSGKMVNNLQFADNSVLLTRSETELWMLQHRFTKPVEDSA